MGEVVGGPERAHPELLGGLAEFGDLPWREIRFEDDVDFHGPATPSMTGMFVPPRL